MGVLTETAPHDRKFRAVLQEAGITLPEKPTMKTAPFDLEKALAGHPLVTAGGLPATKFAHNESGFDYCYEAVIEDCIYTFAASGIHDLTYPNNGYSLLLALPDDPPLSPEEQAVIDAMRAGRKVTVEKPPKPAMPRRCGAAYFPEEEDDPWGGAFPLGYAEYEESPDQIVQLIELTPEVSTALLTAGIRWEDAPTRNPLPEVLPPLPKGVMYLGIGGSFETAGVFEGWSWDREKPAVWDYDTCWAGSDTTRHYAAPSNSKIARLNSKP